MSTTALAPQKLAPLKAVLEKAMPSLDQALPATIKRYMTPERITKITLAAVGRTPGLLKCNPTSIVQCVMEAAALGIDPSGGALGQGYMVPYGDRATFILGYRGSISLARRSGDIQSVEAHVVHKNDHFEFSLGLDQKLVHRPYLEGDPGDMVCVYCIARFKSGGHHLEVMTKSQVDRIRDRARAKSGPWSTDYEEMAKKTCVRRAAKYWPLSTEDASVMGQAFDLEDSGVAQADPVVVLDVEPEAPKSAADKVKDQMKKNGSSKKESKPKPLSEWTLRQLQMRLNKVNKLGEEAAKKGEDFSALSDEAIELGKELERRKGPRDDAPPPQDDLPY